MSYYMSKYYIINEFSKILGVSVLTLKNWDTNGKLHTLYFYKWVPVLFT